MSLCVLMNMWLSVLSLHVCFLWVCVFLYVCVCVCDKNVNCVCMCVCVKLEKFEQGLGRLENSFHVPPLPNLPVLHQRLKERRKNKKKKTEMLKVGVKEKKERAGEN